MDVVNGIALYIVTPWHQHRKNSVFFFLILDRTTVCHDRRNMLLALNLIPLNSRQMTRGYPVPRRAQQPWYKIRSFSCFLLLREKNNISIPLYWFVLYIPVFGSCDRSRSKHLTGMECCWCLRLQRWRYLSNVTTEPNHVLFDINRNPGPWRLLIDTVNLG